MAASNHRLELEACYLMEWRRKRGGFGLEEYSRNGRSLEFFAFLSCWYHQDRSTWFSYDFSNRYDRRSHESLIAEIVEIESWIAGIAKVKLLIRSPGSQNRFFSTPGDPGNLIDYKWTRLQLLKKSKKSRATDRLSNHGGENDTCLFEDKRHSFPPRAPKLLQHAFTLELLSLSPQSQISEISDSFDTRAPIDQQGSIIVL